MHRKAAAVGVLAEEGARDRDERAAHVPRASCGLRARRSPRGRCRSAGAGLGVRPCRSSASRAVISLTVVKTSACARARAFHRVLGATTWYSSASCALVRSARPSSGECPSDESARPSMVACVVKTVPMLGHALLEVEQRRARHPLVALHHAHGGAPAPGTVPTTARSPAPRRSRTAPARRSPSRPRSNRHRSRSQSSARIASFLL